MNTVVTEDEILKKLIRFTEFKKMKLMDENGKVVAVTGNQWAEAKPGDGGNLTEEKYDPDSQTEGTSFFLKCLEKNYVLWVDEKAELSKEKEYGLNLAVRLIEDYEREKRRSSKRINQREKLLEFLLGEEDGDVEEFRTRAETLGLKEKMIRVPILISPICQENHILRLYQAMKNTASFSEQDLMGTTGDGNLILFKTVSCPGKKFMQEYKYILAEALSGFLHEMRTQNIRYSIYFGPAQEGYDSYRQAYEYCIWMKQNISKEGSFYFYDNVVKYLESVASLQKLDTIFKALMHQMNEKQIQNYMETMEVLIDKDYSLIKASESLHIHKNTLIYRLDKIREVLNMNPLLFNTDREFMEGFYFYLKRKN